MPIMMAPPSWSYYSKAPPPNTTTLEVRFQLTNFGGTQTFSLEHIHYLTEKQDNPLR